MKPHNTTFRLAAAFCLLAAVLMVVGWQGISRLRQLNAQVQNIVFQQWKEERLANEALGFSDRNSQITLLIFLMDDRNEIKQLLAQRADNTQQITELIGAIEPLLEPGTETGLFAAVKATRTPYVQSYERALALLLTEHQPDEARKMMVDVVRPNMIAYHEAWSAFDRHQSDQIKEIEQQSQIDFAADQRDFVLMLALAGLVTIAIAIFTVVRMHREMVVRHRAEQSLQLVHEGLEMRVTERTAELANSNEALQVENVDRRRAEEELRAKETRLKTYIKENYDLRAALDEHSIVAITDARGKITFVNDKFCAISKYAREELLGQDHRIINSGHHPKEFIRDLWTTIAHGNVWHGELKNKAKDGSFYWVDTTIMPFLDEHGKPRQYIAIRTDITERKRAEAAAKELAAIVKFSDDAIIGKNPQSIVTSWNAGAEKVFGYSASEMIGQPITRIIPPDRQQEEDLIMGPINAGGIVDHFETRRLTKDGRLIDVSVTVSPIKDAQGQITGASKIVRDITESKAAEAKIHQLNMELEKRVVERTAQLEAANKELEAFSYSVSHDLRAPLRAVDGFSQAVLEDYGSQLPEEGRRYLHTIRNGAQRMGVLIDDLLTFSRLSRLPLSEHEVNTGLLVEGVLAELNAGQPGRPVKIQLGELPSCQGDAALLKQVWINLLSNAYKYTRKRDPAVIEIGCKSEQGEHVFFVRDNGVGFDMQYAHKLFGVFQRLHRSDEFEGTGVGLAIVQRVVHRHGGRVWAEAAVDRGATFYFTLKEKTKL
jgi:PAS domain S-box-containing protein